MRWKLPPRPVLGTLPLGQLNAHAIRVPGGEGYVVAFQRGVVGFINLLTKAVAAALPHEQDPQTGRIDFNPDLRVVDERLREDDEPVSRLAAFLAAYVLGGHPHSAPPYVLKGRGLVLATLLRRSGQLFVGGHEYGHIAAGHLVSKKDVRHFVGDVEVPIISVEWKDEYEADFVGMVLITKALQGELDLAMSYAELICSFLR